MTSTSRSSRVAAGSKATVAWPVIRFTDADLTPGVRSSERCTRPLQAAQVMPATAIVPVALAIDIVQPERVAGIADGDGERSGAGCGLVEAHAGPTDLHRLDLDTRESGERAAHGLNAVAAAHAVDSKGQAGHRSDS